MDDRSRRSPLERLKFAIAFRARLAALFNVFGTHLPIGPLRVAWLRLLGAKIGQGTLIGRGTTVLAAGKLVVGSHSTVGLRCVLDARGGIRIGEQASVENDTQILSTDHDPDAPNFALRDAPIVIGDHAWLATRVLVLKGVTIGDGAVVTAGSLVNRTVGDNTVASGFPARPVGDRPSGPDARSDRRLNFRWHSASLYNLIGTHVPSHAVRLTWLRFLGARIGVHTSVFRGTTVLEPSKLVIGDHCSIGWRCVLDARAGIELADNVTLSSDTQLITNDHDPNSAEFGVRAAPISVGERAWLATRVTVLKGVSIGDGAVIGAGSIVTDDVEPYVIAAGLPARPIGKRSDDLTYFNSFRPFLY